MLEAVRPDKLSPGGEASLNWFKTTFMRTFSLGSITRKSMAKLIKEDEEFTFHLFRLMDSDENGSLCLQEFIGGLQRLGRGQMIEDDVLLALGQAFSRWATGTGEVQAGDFHHLSMEDVFQKCFFRLFDLDGNRNVTATEFLIGLDKLARMNNDIKWYSWLEHWFAQHATHYGEITKADFLKALNVSSGKSHFAERLFEVIDTDQSGTVSVTELQAAVFILTQGSPKQRLMILFSIYDIDSSGRLDYSEMRTVLEWCLSDSSMEQRDRLLDNLTSVLFEHLDKDNNGSVSRSEFEDFLNQYPHVAENLTISFVQCLRPGAKRRRFRITTLQRYTWRTIYYVGNNFPLVTFWFLYVTANVVLFVTAAAKYWDNNNIFVALARGCGQNLNFSPVFIVVLMYRNTLTFLRSSRVGVYLPLDHSIDAHKVIGVVIMGYSLLHTAMHICNFVTVAKVTNVTVVEYLFTFQDGVGWVGGSACLTGWGLVLILAVIGACSLPCVRRRGHFQLFYWTHFLFLLWWAVLVLHGPRFWKWLIGPALVYFIEKLWRYACRESGSTLIRSAIPVSAKLTRLSIDRPRGFNFNAGDYIFLKIPQIAQFEWHPFTISSAPEENDTLSLHIQSFGNWTKRVRVLAEKWSVVGSKWRKMSNPHAPGTSRSTSVQMSPNVEIFSRGSLFEEESHMASNIPPVRQMDDHLESNVQIRGQRSHAGRILLSEHQYENPAYRTHEDQDVHTNRVVKRAPMVVKVSIDGPFGSPSTAVYTVEHAVLIGAGIGVTPYASILQSMMFRYKKQRAVCPQCHFSWMNPLNDVSSSTPRKVDFIWVNRSFESIEWFLNVLRELEEEQQLMDSENPMLDMSLYVTSALCRTDIRAVALQMAIELFHKRESRDPLCGLRTRIQPGRPDWKTVFDNISAKARYKVTTFYCGPPQLGKKLAKLCNEYDFNFRQENF